MNGGYLIIDTKWLFAIYKMLFSGKQSETIPGIYDYFKDAYSTGKMLIFSGSLNVNGSTVQPASIFMVNSSGTTYYTLLAFIETKIVSVKIEYNDTVTILGG